ncbi:sodium:solute symporter family protein [Clostridium ganghwense]|uniref:Sodium:solute symporter family protein n=1 Tax=Clostridium ganghwense TaxID=312089 RepID=A0ABT4CJG6_9CLOT|nr:sodium:solute symporter family protein [Clostridium ganghwense]MCY6369195.1 sodium:solute symporter family protein [Clostridium ganghwense]
MFIFSAIITLLLTGVVGYLGNSRVKTSKDFIVGGNKLGAVGVTSMLMGSIIGGASTVGTTQMAYNHGVVAIWFITGLCIASIILGIFYSKQVDKKDWETIPQIIGDTYGKNARTSSSILLSIGMFIHVNGQIIACIALFTAIFGMSVIKAAFIVVMLLVIYVVFGGFWGSTLVGGLKTILLYSTTLICGGILLVKLNGFKEIMTILPKEPWFNLFSGSVSEDLASVLSTVVGVLSTQTYFQAIMSGRDSGTSKKSAFLVAFLVFPIGIVCTAIGMYMRIHYPSISAREAFPLFLINYLNPGIAGIAIATVLISSTATGAGLTLGISTMLTRDVYKQILNPKCDDRKELLVLRIIIVIIGIMTFFVVINNKETMILNWGFLSMVFRATPIFIPTVMAIVFKDKIHPKAGLYAIVSAPAVSTMWIFSGLPQISSIYIGLITSIIAILFMSKYLKYKGIENYTKM